MNERNKSLFNKILKSPLEFNLTDFDHLIQSYQLENHKFNVQEAFNDFRECVRRIYNLNEDRLRETSNANLGIHGELNKRSTILRQKKYFKRVENQKPGKKYVKIYAEGDSWFLFPIFVKDIIDWLAMNENYLIYSDAYSGDWITNIIYEGQYIEGLTIHSPDVFLISGGGNDLVGNERLSIMISDHGNEITKHTEQSLQYIHNKEHRDLILLAQPYITKEFYAFIWILRAQYTMLFNGIYKNTNKFNKMISITHGYAYPFPQKGSNFSWNNPLQYFVNSLIDTGKWLYRPLMIKGIFDTNLQRAIVMALIYEYNEMLRDIANQFDNVYYIDCRDIPLKKNDWYDELHLKSHKYKEVAMRYKKLIDEKIS